MRLISYAFAALLFALVSASAQGGPSCLQTPAPGTSNTQCANTAFVTSSISGHTVTSFTLGSYGPQSGAVALALDLNLTIGTGTTSTNGPYVGGGSYITVASNVGMFIGQILTLTYDDASTQNLTIASFGNSPFGQVINFTGTITAGKTMSAGDTVTFLPTLGFVGGYFPPYYPTGFGAAPTGHAIPYLDNDSNTFSGNTIGIKSSDYSTGGSIVSFTTAPHVSDQVYVYMATGAGLLSQAVGGATNSIQVASANYIGGSTLVGQSVTIGSSTYAVSSVTGASSPYTMTLGTTVSSLPVGTVIQYPVVGSLAPQVGTVAASYTNPSSIVVDASIPIPAGQAVHLLLASGPTTVSGTVQSMTPNSGCTPYGPPCAMTLTFTGTVTGTFAANDQLFWDYVYTNNYGAPSSPTMNSVLQAVANQINIVGSLPQVAGVQAVLQGVSSAAGTLIIEPKRFGSNLNPSTIVLTTGGHLAVSSYSQPGLELDAASIITLSRNAAGYAGQIDDVAGFLEMSSTTNTGNIVCCTAQYGSIIAYVGSPAAYPSTLGILAFLTAGSAGINRRMDIERGVALYTDAGVSAGDIGAGTFDVPGTGGYYLDGLTAYGTDIAGTSLRLNGFAGIQLNSPPTKSCGGGIVSDSSGNLGCLVSSRRFKDHIVPLKPSQNAIASLDPVKFKYRADFRPKDQTEHFGLIAEQVYKVAPQCVYLDGDAKPFTVDFNCVTALLIVQVKKQQREIDRLKITARRRH